MSLGLIVWTVFCLGLGFALGAESKEAMKALLTALGVAALLWAVGMALWMFAEAIV